MNPLFSTLLSGARGLKRRPLAPRPTPWLGKEGIDGGDSVQDDKYSPSVATLRW